MTQTCTTAGKKALMSVMAAFAACILAMSCSTPAFAKEDPGWGATEYAYNNSAGGANTDGNINDGSSTGGNAGTENNDNGGTSEGSSDDNSSDNTSSRGNSNSAEAGFTTP